MPLRTPAMESLKTPLIASLFLCGVASASCEGEVGPMLVLATHVEGTLVDKDLRPVPNVRVERAWKWVWNGKRGSDVCTTDARGHFEFPVVKGFSLTASVLPHQPQIDTGRAAARADAANGARATD